MLSDQEKKYNGRRRRVRGGVSSPHKSYSIAPVHPDEFLFCISTWRSVRKVNLWYTGIYPGGERPSSTCDNETRTLSTMHQSFKKNIYIIISLCGSEEGLHFFNYNDHSSVHNTAFIVLVLVLVLLLVLVTTIVQGDGMAQLVERQAQDPKDRGSNHIRSTTMYMYIYWRRIVIVIVIVIQ